VAISARLAKELLDWAPVTSFPAGLRLYLDWLGERAAGARS
jgi:nucleoside-diphosphate-sugar epimerase